MKNFFSSLYFKIGSVLILTEMIILAIVGFSYANSFSDQIDKRVEDRVRLPGILVNNSLVRVIAIRDVDSLKLLVGEEIEDAILIDVDNLTSTYSLSGEFDGIHIDEIEVLENEWFNTEDPQEVIVRTNEGNTQFMVGVSPIIDPITGSLDSYLYVKTNLKQTENEKRDLERRLFIGSLVTMLASFFVIFISFRFMVFTRIANVLSTLRQLEEGDLGARVDGAASNDEIGVLQRGVNSMADKRQEAQQALVQLNEELEERVVARTRELEIAADVSKQITTVLDLETLLEQVALLTSQGFDLYASTIFLLDAKAEKLESAAGIVINQKGQISRPGAWAIALEAEPSIVAKSGRDRAVVLVNDVTNDTLYLQNPTFLETQSEIAIPMIIGKQLLGVFDLQSRQVNRFSDNDVRVLTSLAEQITIVIRNAQLYTEAQTARKDAERSNSVKSQFLAAMSHELRTPLNGILNYVQFVSSGMLGEVNEKQIDVLKKTKVNGLHLLSLINDVLDISKIEAGSLTLFVEDNIDLRPEVEAVIDTGRTMLDSKPVEITAEIADNLPLIRCDKRRIRQIMLNLVSNACKFTEQGSVTVRLNQQDGEIIITVQDTGPGIPPEHHQTVFEPFQQTEAGLRKASGTGLGLPISKRLAEAHGGRLGLISAVGQGATFSVALPIKSEILVPTLEL